jgi:hypothetical protein
MSSLLSSLNQPLLSSLFGEVGLLGGFAEQPATGSSNSQNVGGVIGAGINLGAEQMLGATGGPLVVASNLQSAGEALLDVTPPLVSENPALSGLGPLVPGIVGEPGSGDVLLPAWMFGDVRTIESIG